ncbi:MAG: GIY-YIG nuclease family protein [Cyanobacteria bacterium]|nr:GIY-YIG nuclease family protein [Cyanobacteria bacterium CG_2015-16_32_12]NCO78176.1 GIY-YIG nuclease family protein [Cyanobacteria bacterium CG_2015-22_32_23]NCQ05785.1 GIY-YIG nuclease family protein [Cyanobacteria bacterium CG_2015-09_32_10]NCQ40323.1 GIY-YIG nuclease family protein [Cyanobacteria bacterium CG_2015-04_32_10]NCS84885.1 GIY-YIG nuclease family protein [Cyanobacteria bacterium CG_2015-02_32_10]
MSDSSLKILLKDLNFVSYIEEKGVINPELEGKIGIYAIFNEDKILEYVGYSRNLFMSLKQHLVRQPDKCYWLKFYLIPRPSRTILEEIRSNWLTENINLPKGNNEEENLWIQPIDAKLTMTEEDKIEYQKNDELGKIKFLKKIARRLEEKVKQKLENRKVTMEIRFNPKLKEDGLLDLK